MRKSLVVLVVVTIAWAFATISFAQAQSAVKPAVTVKPPIAAAKIAAPPATAKKGTSIGKPGGVSTSIAPSDTDSYWVQEIDIDGDGDLEDVEVLWDDEDKLMYFYDELDVDCALTDGTASSSLLIAIYGNGNTAKAPKGSGWWVSSLDQGECAAEETDVYGCTFDAAGNATECAEVDTYVNDVIVFE